MPTDLQGYVFDFRAGYVLDGCPLPGFCVLGENAQNTLVALGGYTTPLQAQGHIAWTDHLLGQLGGGTKARILSGCTDGYASAQEMLRFVRDVILLKPRLVILLSGFYDLAYQLGFVPDSETAAFLRTHPFATPRQMAFVREITSWFGLGNTETYYGEEQQLPAGERWLVHMDILRGLCQEFGLGLRVFLQPCVFSGCYQISEGEAAVLRQMYGVDDTQLAQTRAAFQAEYASMAKGAAARGFIEDLSGLFDARREVYEDALHLTPALTPALAEAICASCKREALL